MNERQWPAVPAPLWVARSAQGLLQRDSTESGRLVRLEDVADWKAANAVRHEAVAYEIFGPLVRDEGSEARHLHLVNMRGYAVPFVEPCEGPDGPYRLTLETSAVWTALPGLARGSGLDDLARTLGDGWRRAWSVPPLQDIDAEWGAQRVVARNRERDALTAATADGGAFEDWPSDEALLKLLRRVAVPQVQAMRLWDYGRSSEPALVHAPQLAPAAPFPLVDFPALVAYRTATPRASWAEGNQRELVRAAIDLHGAKVVAEQLGMSRQGLSKAVTRSRKRRSAASPFPTASSTGGQRVGR